MVRLAISKFSSSLSHLLNFRQQCRTFFWKKKKKEFPYMIMRATPADYVSIQQIMREFYFPEEPTVRALGLGRKRNPIFEHHVQTQLEEGLTLIARCKFSGDVAGASINRTACAWDPDLTDRLACTFTCNDTRMLYHFYAYIQRAPCLWQKYCTDKIFEISQLVVRGGDRGKGVGLTLLQASRELGADCGYRVVRVDATSHYTSKICEKVKMQMVFEIPYCKYTGKGPAQVPVFKPPSPHDSCKIYIDTPFLVK